MISHSRQARAALPTPPFFLARPSAATDVPRPPTAVDGRPARRRQVDTSTVWHRPSSAASHSYLPIQRRMESCNVRLEPRSGAVGAHALSPAWRARARASWRRRGFGPNRIPNERDTPARLCEWDGPAHAPTTSPGVPLPPGHPFVLARRIKPAGRGSTPSLALTVEATRRRAVEATRSHCGGP